MDKVGAPISPQLVSARRERGSIVLTANKSYGEWDTVFGDSAIVTAILDRLVYRPTTVSTCCGSYTDPRAAAGPA